MSPLYMSMLPFQEEHIEIVDRNSSALQSGLQLVVESPVPASFPARFQIEARTSFTTHTLVNPRLPWRPTSARAEYPAMVLLSTLADSGFYHEWPCAGCRTGSAAESGAL
jgi:hypothetical protein